MVTSGRPVTVSAVITGIMDIHHIPGGRKGGNPDDGNGDDDDDHHHRGGVCDGKLQFPAKKFGTIAPHQRATNHPPGTKEIYEQLKLAKSSVPLLCCIFVLLSFATNISEDIQKAYVIQIFTQIQFSHRGRLPGIVFPAPTRWVAVSQPIGWILPTYCLINICTYLIFYLY